MDHVGYLFLAGTLSFFMWAITGFTSDAIPHIAGITTLLAIPWYFETRNRAHAPSRLELIFATVWVWFRRIVGVTVGSFFILAACFYAVFNTSGNSVASKLLIAFGGAVIGLFIIYIGIVGRNGIAFHESNKRRYKWRR